MIWGLGAIVVVACGCATGGNAAKSGPGAGADVALLPGSSPTVATATSLALVGARCSQGICKCREPGRDDDETTPPGEGSKRFEIGFSAAGGIASLDLSGLGTVATVPLAEKETCAYIDVPSGSTNDVIFVAKESVAGQGVAPRLRVAEYGPKGPFWYDVVTITCDGPQGRCDRTAADAWGAAARQRKRGRLDPCGSTVVTRLVWETSGGQVERDGGLFRDFTARFTMEVKKFATQFAPGSTECVPK